MDGRRFLWGLNGLIARSGITRVRWALEPGHPGPGGNASIGGDYARLILVLTGSRRVRVMNGGKAQRLDLEPGDCLVLGPHVITVTEVDQPFLTLSVALEARNPRLVITRSSRRGRRRAFTSRPFAAPGLCDDFSMRLSAGLLAATRDAPRGLYARRLAETLWLRLVERGCAPTQERPKSRATFGAAEHFIREHLGEHLDRALVARRLGIHPGHVTRLFLRFAGESFGGFLLRVRLESARNLLRHQQHTVSEAAYLTGFTSVSYFVRAYRKHYRATPGRHRLT